MLCIIPARGGSRRIPNKNRKLFHGQPIIAYSIEAALDSNLFEAVYVSTDDEEIAKVANDYGALHIERLAGMAVDEVGTQTVMRYDLGRLEARHPDHFACCLYATAPLITVGELQRGFRDLVSIGLPYVMSTDHGGNDIGGFYFGFTHAFLSGTPLTPENTFYFPVEYDIDINTPEDWARAEKLYEEIYL